MRALREHGTATDEYGWGAPDLGELLYGNEFPHWFVTHSRNQYGFDWKEILLAVRNTHFFFPQNTYFRGPGANITDQRYLGKDDAAVLGEWLLRRLAALASTLPEGQDVARSLELDGFQVDPKNLQLVPLDSVTSEREEEERVVSLVKQSGLGNSTVILKLSLARTPYTCKMNDLAKS
jgi:hypothetical protein